ncbi:MAG: cysteine--tRNA ligase [Clostridia bacterium]|nr:cysteine--tRNA ligase [Clostridia bacterium]MBQ7047610.1 cysteine--tRNA ligase [Clostridia bacterium]
MKLYNTLTRQKDELVVVDNTVRMYVCGPTVYNYFHIGNARVFVVFDMLRRYLEYRGYNVKFVQNFTDVDDKLIKRAAEENSTVPQIAEKYIEEYFKDAKGLGINPATFHPRATETIGEIIEMVQKLIDNGHAYVMGGDVYFDTESYKEYGKLSHRDMESQEAGARIEVNEDKKNSYDFALWKARKEDSEIAWESPWGMGRPGWHIECSAMVYKFLGTEIDIHGGGQDLAFPHHENEVAQTECATGKCLAKIWMHNGYINVDNKKMSKSLGNFFTVRDVAEKYDYQVIRYFLLSPHYRSPVNYSAEILEQAKGSLERLQNCEENLSFRIKNAVGSEISDAEKATLEAVDKKTEEMKAAMDDDFNTADAISCVFEAAKLINTAMADASASKTFLESAYEKYHSLLVLFGLEIKSNEQGDEAEIEALLAERTAAKKEKNYQRADEIRNVLAERGIIIEDTPQGPKWKRV